MGRFTPSAGCRPVGQRKTRAPGLHVAGGALQRGENFGCNVAGLHTQQVEAIPLAAHARGQVLPCLPKLHYLLVIG